MRLHNETAEIFIPDDTPVEAALARTTHLAVGAHQDDLEIMAYHGISACMSSNRHYFTGVVATSGGGSSRTGPYSDLTDEEMAAVRRHEQRKAAVMGEYGALFQLGYESSEVKDSKDLRLVEDLESIFLAARPETVYLHNPADRHDTHVASFLRALAALRRLPAEARPARVLGCEVWRDLDWLGDDEKVALDVSDRPHVAASLVGLFDSQIGGGKRYDLATQGRRLAHATYHESHASDDAAALTFAMDLTVLVDDPGLSPARFTLDRIERFRKDVSDRLHDLF